LEHARKAVSVESSIVIKKGDESSTAMGLTLAYKTLGEAEWSGMAYGSLADRTAALNDLRKGLAIASAELERAPENTALTRRRAFLRIQIATTLAQNGSRSEAIQELRSLLAYFRSVGAASNSTRSQRDLGTALEELGFVLERDGQLPESVACFKEELAVLTKLFHSDTGNLQTRFDWMGASFNIAESLVRQGKADQALPLLKQSVSDEEQLIAMDPKRPEYRTWLAYFRVIEAKALVQLHRERQALANLQEARELYEGIARSDQLDVDEQLSTAATDAKIAAILLRMGDVDRARQIFQRAVEASEPASGGSDPKLQAQFTLADSYAGLGDVSSLLAAKAESQRQNGLSTDACAWYEKSLRVWHTIPNPSLISPNGFDTDGPTRVEHQRALSKCSAGKGALPPSLSRN
jgi:tetratricopeptide (TPR) repeat protein